MYKNIKKNIKKHTQNKWDEKLGRNPGERLVMINYECIYLCNRQLQVVITYVSGLRDIFFVQRMGIVGIMRCSEFLSFGSQPGVDEEPYPHLMVLF